MVRTLSALCVEVAIYSQDCDLIRQGLKKKSRRSKKKLQLVFFARQAKEKKRGAVKILFYEDALKLSTIRLYLVLMLTHCLPFE